MHPVFRTEQSVEAHVITHILEGHGIKTIITGETTLGSSGYYGTTKPNISVCVISADDAKKAQEIISNWEKKNPVNDTSTQAPPKALYKENRNTKTNTLIFIWGFTVGALCTFLYMDDITTILSTLIK